MTDETDRIALLSPRQREIMRAVADRLSSKEIAGRLGLSPATVDSHIAEALRRLNLSSRRDAALLIVKADEELTSSTDPAARVDAAAHHGDDPSPQSPPVPIGTDPAIWVSSPRMPSGAFGHGGGSRGDGGIPDQSGPSGMRAVLLRYVLDAFYITLFFAIMSAAAFGVHEIVDLCERSAIDPVELFILRSVGRVLVGLDAVGVVTATGVLLFRFIRALARTHD